MEEAKPSCCRRQSRDQRRPGPDDSDFSDFSVSQLMSPTTNSRLYTSSDLADSPSVTSPTDCMTPDSNYQPSPRGPSPPYRHFLPDRGSTPMGKEMERTPPQDVYYEEEEWIPFADLPIRNAEISAIPGGSNSNYIVIEEEIVEEVPPAGTPGSRGGIIKRIRRKITRKAKPPGAGLQQRLAAIAAEDEPECCHVLHADPNAQREGDRYRWRSGAPQPQWLSELQQTDPMGFATCAEFFSKSGRWPTDEELGPGPDAVPAPQGGFNLRPGCGYPPFVERARQEKNELLVGNAFEHFQRFGRWPRRR